MNDKIIIAKILKPRGLKGQVKALLFADPNFLVSAKTVYIDEKKYTIKSVNLSGNCAFITLNSIVNIDEAEKLRGKEVFVQSDMTDLANDEIFASQLINLVVRYESGVELGRVKSVQNFGAGEIIEVQNIATQNQELQNQELQNIATQNYEVQKCELQNIATQNYEVQKCDVQNIATQNHAVRDDELQNHEVQKCEVPNHLTQNYAMQDSATKDNLGQNNLAKKEITKNNLAKNEIIKDNLTKNTKTAILKSNITKNKTTESSTAKSATIMIPYEDAFVKSTDLAHGEIVIFDGVLDEIEVE